MKTIGLCKTCKRDVLIPDGFEYLSPNDECIKCIEKRLSKRNVADMDKVIKEMMDESP